MTKLPSFQFYPGDWFKDPDLRRCSKTAKGVWMDMICLSFECKERGVFSAGGVPWSDQEIAAALGGDIAENLSAIAELLSKGVCSRNESGAIFCRRVVRDEHIRRVKSVNGKLGGRPKCDNKNLNKTKSKAKRKLSESTSSSSSSSNTPLPPKGGLPSAGLSKDDLGDTGKLAQWLSVKGLAIGLSDSRQTLNWLVAAGLRSIAEGDDPVGLFIHQARRIASGDTGGVGDDWYDRAKIYIRDATPGATLAESNGVENVD